MSDAHCAICGKELREAERHWYTNLCEAHADGYGDEQPRAARPAAVPAEAIRALAERWQADAVGLLRTAKQHEVDGSALSAGSCQGSGESFNECASDLLRLLGEGDG